jgi:hypothetical protein
MCTQKKLFFPLVPSIKKANNFVKNSARNCSNISQLVAALFTSGRARAQVFVRWSRLMNLLVHLFVTVHPRRKSENSIRRQVCFAIRLRVGSSLALLIVEVISDCRTAWPSWCRASSNVHVDRLKPRFIAFCPVNRANNFFYGLATNFVAFNYPVGRAFCLCLYLRASGRGKILSGTVFRNEKAPESVRCGRSIVMYRCASR